MIEKLFDVDQFLSETERRARELAREINPESRAISDQLNRFVKEVRIIKSAVIREVQSAAA